MKKSHKFKKVLLLSSEALVIGEAGCPPGRENYIH